MRYALTCGNSPSVHAHVAAQPPLSHEQPQLAGSRRTPPDSLIYADGDEPGGGRPPMPAPNCAGRTKLRQLLSSSSEGGSVPATAGCEACMHVHSALALALAT